MTHVSHETDAASAAPPPSLTLDEPVQRRRLADSRPTTLGGRLRETLYYMRGRGALEIGLIYALMLAVFVVWSLVDPLGFPFLSSNNLSGVVTQSVPVLAILAIGVGMLMVTGEFDLSVGFVLSFAGIVFIKLAQSHDWVVAALLTVAVAIAATTANGLIVVYTRIPSFVATLGMSFVWKGAGIAVNGTAPAYLAGADPTFVKTFAGDFGFFRAQILWMILLGVVAFGILQRHRVGNRLYAVGGNAGAAKAVSIKPDRMRMFAYAFLGLCVGLAAILVVARTSTMQPTTTEEYTLLAVAAAVVGGCALDGGRGTVIGMIVGAALIRTTENALILANAPGLYVQAFFGISIVVAAVINKYVEERAQ
ncbi:ABC transporter permease [Nocardioides acrostichi]|uniref:ABC transporter permease n=1 Tax=Nocardioides acrostichi TaxID=2784339 RepID=A0A930V3V6_9ACTN|nr:ABC transporter permease [Nocardioides acrostichi]MBF4163366.1 ABC transporter permease [Nocardioides acrostichi]